ncbi:MAG: hypothetical protein WCY09_02145 [Candidatus Omnitrophota bacterium]
MTELKKNAVYPVRIFSEAWGVFRKNVVRLCSIYFIFYVPYLLLSVLANVLPGDQSNILLIIIAFVSIWCSVALLFAVNKATDQESFSIKESIMLGMKKYSLNYVGIILLLFLFGLLILLAMLAAFYVASLLLKVSSILAIVLQILCVVLGVCLVVYFMIRWSLGWVCILENINPFAALKRSRVLIKGHVNPVVGEYALFIMASIVANIPYLILTLIFTSPDANQEIQILGAAINSVVVYGIVSPFVVTIMVVLYKKLKEVNAINVHP